MIGVLRLVTRANRRHEFALGAQISALMNGAETSGTCSGRRFTSKCRSIAVRMPTSHSCSASTVVAGATILVQKLFTAALIDEPPIRNYGALFYVCTEECFTFDRRSTTSITAIPLRKSAADAGSGIAEALIVPLPDADPPIPATPAPRAIR